jgi:hypothetical protein
MRMEWLRSASTSNGGFPPTHCVLKVWIQSTPDVTTLFARPSQTRTKVRGKKSSPKTRVRTHDFCPLRPFLRFCGPKHIPRFNRVLAHTCAGHPRRTRLVRADNELFEGVRPLPLLNRAHRREICRPLQSEWPRPNLGGDHLPLNEFGREANHDKEDMTQKSNGMPLGILPFLAIWPN